MLNTSEIVSGVDQTLKVVIKNAILPNYHLQYTQVLDARVWYCMCMHYNQIRTA